MQSFGGIWAAGRCCVQGLRFGIKHDAEYPGCTVRLGVGNPVRFRLHPNSSMPAQDCLAKFGGTKDSQVCLQADLGLPLQDRSPRALEFRDGRVPKRRPEPPPILQYLILPEADLDPLASGRR